MPKKMSRKGKPKVHKELPGFDIRINEFGEMESDINIDKINRFLDGKISDKKLTPSIKIQLSEEEE